jgi:hypothetical protein
LLHERSVLGLKRYRDHYEAGKVGKEVHSKSGKDLPGGGYRREFSPGSEFSNYGSNIKATARSLGS